jgi:hypothetical protein
MTADLALSCIASAQHVDLLASLYADLHEHQARVAPRLGGVLPARSADEAWERRRPSYVA